MPTLAFEHIPMVIASPMCIMHVYMRRKGGGRGVGVEEHGAMPPVYLFQLHDNEHICSTDNIAQFRGSSI